MSEVWIVLTDDWELRGNGTGTVDEFQRKPALRLMDLYDSLGIKATFNLEVMQQIAFETHADRFPEIRAGRDAWLATVREMSRRGFDIQLHIHPQWWLAEYINGWWKLGSRWNIADYLRTDIETICDLAFAYMAPLVAPRTIQTFRAGSWGLGPPSRDTLNALISRGVKVDVSIASGLRYRGEAITLDYSRVDSPYQAYVPDIDDVRRINRNVTAPAIIEIPTQTVTHRQLFAKYLRDRLRGADRERLAPLGAYLREWLRTQVGRTVRKVIPRRRRLGDSGGKSDSNAPAFVMRDPFGAVAGTAEFGMVFDISGNLDPAVYRHMADIVIARAQAKSGPPVKVLVFENHTKDLRHDGDFERIRQLIDHVRANHSDVQFRTLSDVVEQRASIV